MVRIIGVGCRSSPSIDNQIETEISKVKIEIIQTHRLIFMHEACKIKTSHRSMYEKEPISKNHTKKKPISKKTISNTPGRHLQPNIHKYDRCGL
jgi:hypothetical protein